MDVGVDEAGQHGGAGEVDDLRPGWDPAALLDRCDAPALDEDGDVVARRSARTVDQRAGLDDEKRGRGERGEHHAPSIGGARGAACSFLRVSIAPYLRRGAAAGIVSPCRRTRG